MLGGVKDRGRWLQAYAELSRGRILGNGVCGRERKSTIPPVSDMDEQIGTPLQLDQLHAPVGSLARLVAVGGDGVGLAIALGLEPRGGNAG